MPQPRGRELRQALGELDRGLVGEAGEHHVLQRVELRVERRVDARMAVPEQVDPPGADRVQDAAAFEIVEPDAFGAADRHQRQRLVMLHLGARMPDRAPAAARRASRSRSRRRLDQRIEREQPARPRAGGRTGAERHRRPSKVDLEALARARARSPPGAGMPGTMQFATQPAHRRPHASICLRVSSAWLRQPRRIPTTSTTGSASRRARSARGVALVRGARESLRRLPPRTISARRDELLCRRAAIVVDLDPHPGELGGDVRGDRRA